MRLVLLLFINNITGYLYWYPKPWKSRMNNRRLKPYHYQYNSTTNTMNNTL